MSVIKKEMQEYINVLSEQTLMALKPIITLLVAEESIVETNLTEEDKAIILRGRTEYAKNPNAFISLDQLQ